MNILICGIGAIGSNLTTRLVSDLKDHEITVIDKDVVEDRNIMAGTQFYTNEVVGVPKVEALQFLIENFYGKIITMINDDICTMTSDKFNKYDLIIDCFDNHEARANISQMNKNILHVGFSDQFTFAIEWNEGYKPPTDITSGFDICQMQGASAFVNMVASYAALVTEEFIANNKKIEIVGNKFSVAFIK